MIGKGLLTTYRLFFKHDISIDIISLDEFAFLLSTFQWPTWIGRWLYSLGIVDPQYASETPRECDTLSAPPVPSSHTYGKNKLSIPCDLETNWIFDTAKQGPGATRHPLYL